MAKHVQLRRYNPKNDQWLLDTYCLTNDRYTAHPREKVKELVSESQLFPILIGNEQAVVGFFCLSSFPTTEGFTDNPKALLLRTLSTDERYRGQGYGKAGLLALNEFLPLNFPECDEVVLAVNHKNTLAQKLYRELGFEDTGKRLIGPLGEQYVYRKGY